jgi:hypothetical protein
MRPTDRDRLKKPIITLGKMTSTWELIKAGQYEMACDNADREFHESGSLLSFRNKIFALLVLGRYADSANLCETIIQKSGGDSDSDFIFLGVSQWLLERYSEAIDTWKKAKHTKYTDAAGGVEIPLMLFYASISLKDNSLNLKACNDLGKIYRPRRPKMWPGPIAGYVLEEISEDELRSEISKQAILHEKQLCQAEFYIGSMRYKSGNIQGYYQAMHDALGQGPSSLVKPEFYLARKIIEMRRSEANR